jgi:Ni/Co efflux regulator RcnB
VAIRVPYGGYFDDGYDRLVGDYYGRDCRRYSAYRGEWRRPYRIGYELPHDVAWSYVPSDLHRRLPPPPYGHNYIAVDRDVLLVAEASKRVIDAVVILSGR